MYLSQSFIYKTAVAAAGNIKLRAAEVGNGLLNKPDKKKKKNGLYMKPNILNIMGYICSPVYLILLCNQRNPELNMDCIYCPIFYQHWDDLRLYTRITASQEAHNSKMGRI